MTSVNELFSVFGCMCFASNRAGTLVRLISQALDHPELLCCTNV
ncbi:hypothetical protein ALQ67_101696 [Pseudomonas savastanoi pv. glycinea]|uniref:Uncharacterized protein n=2 Tax=Pseudomonas savastanoi TaxID=29438 RepID=A0A3M3G0K3_PSESG|nr:hypothetical protein ALO55_101260 [Pseudomonas savastanoi pv. phaseolicola]RMM67723.1 hypothetical protein ALQ74_101358 [Pseudomonas savastanoi pv. glycinea]RMM67997.1 hypothetical protein ALQ73_101027 [Pseudomonas savastanoi pv. glycinea]RMN08887.1 hypothetical protein ALQ67_101696 [Pseudomonas savastanoi pv. glycinea]RMN15929.1 hypothetical protein ALQ66_101549 [Pseudomonas savastanoi pv. glycinea]